MTICAAAMVWFAVLRTVSGTHTFNAVPPQASAAQRGAVPVRQNGLLLCWLSIVSAPADTLCWPRHHHAEAGRGKPCEDCLHAHRTGAAALR